MNEHYTTVNLQAALAGDFPANDEDSLERHLASCDECSAAMERLAGEPAWRAQAAALLADDELDARAVARPEWSEADFTVEHLDPSDEPDVLGRLGGYDVLEIIGRGGMGVVLKGYDRELKRCVAIKVLAPHLARSSLARMRFAREAQAAAAVVHPHVLAIHQVQASGRLPFLVMPLVAGESLAERLAAQGALQLKEVLRIGMQAAAGLAAAHEQGLVHRDVKPANILLEKGIERTVVADFGMARAADDVSLTRGGAVAGTPQYMSPEQVWGKPLDGRSDLFSLGCVLYEMATGVSPFRADSIVATMRRLIDDAPQAIDAINPELPPWFISVVDRLLEKEPAKRFGSAKEVSELLEECLAHVQQPATSPLPASLAPYAFRPRWGFNRHRKGILAMFAFLGSGLLGFVLWQAAESPDEGRHSPKNDGARIEAAGHGKGDLARLQGTWEGEARLEHERYIVHFTIEGQDFIQVHRRESDGNETTTRGLIELDESADPKQMTMKVSSVSSSTGPRVPGRIPREVNAIYKLDEKGLTRRSGRRERPAEFDDEDPAQIVFGRHVKREKDRKELSINPDSGEVGAGSSVGKVTNEIEATTGVVSSKTDDGTDNGRKRPDSGSALKVDLEKLLVGTWVGYADRTGEGYTFRADGTFVQRSAPFGHHVEEGTWAFDWNILPPTLVLKVTKSNNKETPVGTVLQYKVVGVDGKRLRFENPNADPLPGEEPRPITYIRRNETPAGDKPAPKREKGQPPVGELRRGDVVGKWSCDDNGLAQVFFTLDLKDDGSFVLTHRDTAVKFEDQMLGVWEFATDHGADRQGVILWKKRWLKDGKAMEGRKGFDILSITVRDGEWVLNHANQGRYVRHQAAEEKSAPPRRGPGDKKLPDGAVLPIGTPQPHSPARVYAVAGTRLASGSQDGTVLVWDPKSHTL